MPVLSCISRFSWKAGGMGRPVWLLCPPVHELSRASRSVTHPTRLETRTKESNICVSHSVLNRLEGRNESKLVRSWCPFGNKRPGRSTDPPTSPFVDVAESERTCWYPKDGELYLGKTKPEETLVEVCSDSDVQIDRQTWAKGRKTNRTI
jgi:hypothetical protein